MTPRNHTPAETDIHRPWDELAAIFRPLIEPIIDVMIPRGAPHYDSMLAFSLGRLDEGRQVGAFFLRRFDEPFRVLDVGSGNGGVSLGLANFRRARVEALDIVINPALRQLRSETGIPFSQVVGSGHDIPYASETFDVVLCLETLEHIADPRSLGREIMRVLKPKGLCMIMTPARVKYLLRPDPHFGIPGLLLLPDNLQRWVVQHILRRTSTYDVEHTFWTMRGIERLFPGLSNAEPIFNEPHFESRIWVRLRKLLWDRIVIVKE